MAQDYDEVRPDVAEASERTLKDVRKMDAPTTKNVRADLEETDLSDGIELPGADARPWANEAGKSETTRTGPYPHSGRGPRKSV